MDQAYYQQMAALEDDHWWFEARRRILKQVVDDFELDPAEATVCEVGCGTGGNLPLLASYGTLWACEPDPRALAYAQARRIGTVQQGALPDALPFRDKQFDLVAMWDVLEHVEADEASLEAIYHLLKPTGTLVLTVPAYRWLWSHHDVVNHHVRRYTKRALVAKMQRAGFRIEHATYFNTLLFPVVAAVRMMQNAIRRKGSDLTMPSARLNRMLLRLFASERHWVARRQVPVGVSILVVARHAGWGVRAGQMSTRPIAPTRQRDGGDGFP